MRNILLLIALDAVLAIACGGSDRTRQRLVDEARRASEWPKTLAQRPKAKPSPAPSASEAPVVGEPPVASVERSYYVRSCALGTDAGPIKCSVIIGVGKEPDAAGICPQVPPLTRKWTVGNTCPVDEPSPLGGCQMPATSDGMNLTAWRYRCTDDRVPGACDTGVDALRAACERVGGVFIADPTPDAGGAYIGAPSPQEPPAAIASHAHE